MSRRIALAVVLVALAGRLALLAAVSSRNPSSFQTLDSADYLG